MLEERDRIVINIFDLLFKGKHITMPKRRSRPEDRVYTKRRRRYSRSPSRGSVTDLDYNRQLASIQLELQLLKAQIQILRREIIDIREQRLSGKKDEEVKRSCIIM